MIINNIFIFIVGPFLRRWLGGGFPRLSKHRLVAMFFWWLLGTLMIIIKQLFLINYLISLIFWCLIWWGHGGFFRIIDITPKERKNKIIEYIIKRFLSINNTQ